MTEINHGRLIALIQEKTKTDTKCEKTAQEVLISEGIYTTSGNLTVKFKRKFSHKVKTAA